MGRIATIAAVLAGAGLLYLGVRTVTRPTLTYFKPSEFGLWWPLMNSQLLVKLDLFRELWGAPVMISPAQGGIGRHDDSNSQHNVNKWGEVRAIDVMPQGMDTAQDRQRAVRLAEQVGFTGIGIYPHWQPRPGIHLDVREGDHVAKWAGLLNDNGQQVYAAIEQGLG